MISFSVRFDQQSVVDSGWRVSLKNVFISLAFALAVAAAQAQEVATCRNPSGHSFYHFDGLMTNAEKGWTDDKITGGVTTLQKGADGSLDILFYDARKKPISAKQDGGLVRLLRQSATTLTVLVYYGDGASTEIYSFFKEKDGSHRFTMLVNKTGDQAVLPKSSLMVGTCDPIRFNVLN